MAFNLKEKKGSTIVEVLVSVIIIGIVSVYGLSFFSSSYRLAMDSKDYSFVLHDLVRKMEMIKGGNYPNIDSNDYYPIGSAEDGSRFDFKLAKNLRDGCSIRYTCETFVDTKGTPGSTSEEKFFGSTKIELKAEWPMEFDSEDRSTITLVNYIARRSDTNIKEF